MEAELRGEKMNMIYLTDYSDQLDYYTPVITTNEEMIKSDPDTVKAFMAAVSKGYEFAISQPEEAAEILIKAVPDLDPELVKKVRNGFLPAIKMMRPAGENKRPKYGKTTWTGCLKKICSKRKWM